MTILPLLLMFHLYETPQESQAACLTYHVDAIACAIPRENQCTIHMPKLQSGYAQDREMLKHEMEHCFLGRTHG